MLRIDRSLDRPSGPEGVCRGASGVFLVLDTLLRAKGAVRSSEAVKKIVYGLRPPGRNIEDTFPPLVLILEDEGFYFCLNFVKDTFWHTAHNFDFAGVTVEALDLIREHGTFNRQPFRKNDLKRILLKVRGNWAGNDECRLLMI